MPAIRRIVTCYVLAVTLFTAAIALDGLEPGGMNHIDRLSAPLFVSWQLTRDCDLACMHCCTDSSPGHALPDEMNADEAMAFAADIVRADVPYVMLCGGEPLRRAAFHWLSPNFLATPA